MSNGICDIEADFLKEKNKASPAIVVITTVAMPMYVLTVTVFILAIPGVFIFPSSLSVTQIPCKNQGWDARVM